MSGEERTAQSAVPKGKLAKMKSFTEALKDKYCDVGDIDNNINIVIFGKPSRKREDSESSEGEPELGHLRTVVLNKMKISHAGLPSSGLASLCPNISDLDLQGNSLTSWRETLTILSHLPCLKFVNLSSNKFIHDQETLAAWNHPLKSVEDLVLNRTEMTWEEVLSLAQLTPNLKELHICDNGYQTISDGNLQALESIETLRLNNNNIQEWAEFWKLRHLPQLQSLILSGNPVEVVFYDQSSDSTLPSDSPKESTCDLTNEKSVSVCASVLDDIVSSVNSFSQNCIDDCSRLEINQISASNSVCNDQVQTYGDQDDPEYSSGQIRNEAQDGLYQLPNYNTQDCAIGKNCDRLTQKAMTCDTEAPHSVSQVAENNIPQSPVGENSDKPTQKATTCDIEAPHGVNQLPNTTMNTSVVKETCDRPTPGSTRCGISDTTSLSAVRITVLNSGNSTQENFSFNKNAHLGSNPNASQEVKHFVQNNCDSGTVLSGSTADGQSSCRAELEMGGNRDSAKPFRNLSMLCLSQTRLSDWEHLSAINSFPSIKSLRITGISLADDLPQDDRRKLFLACLPSVKVLNGGEVSQTEREKAERHFLRHFLQKEEKPERYLELEQKHGKLTPLVEIDLTRGFQEWVTVKFVYNGTEVLEDKIRVMENVGKLKTFIRQKLCKKLGITRFKMWHLACGPFHSSPGVELEELFLDSLPLSRFDVQEADEIHIEQVEGFKPGLQLGLGNGTTYRW
ncbi:uncharacterized protein LOC135463851 [Liolophura sinensis]|uniref:uncharacterized protein LOC135463851 n=1 Tax=Liolophura sinensis TaxID=3198878 RepID=UPI0031585978